MKKAKEALSEIKKIKNLSAFYEWLFNSATRPELAEFVLTNPLLRKTLFRLLILYLRRAVLSNKRFPAQVQRDKFYMAKALIGVIEKTLERAQKHPEFRKALFKSVYPKALKVAKEAPQKREKFRKKFHFDPPGFLTISPGKFCNLHCKGCYANSSAATKEKLDWGTVDRIITEKTEEWGSWFTVVSGGEPFLWESEGKTLIDLARKHQDNLFLVYTNGTLIDKKMAQELAKVGNITPAISVEGFAKETDARRGKGVFKKILQAFKNLNEVGVPFGISMTATRENADLITSEKLMKYYWSKGACYAWIFQLMPIGRGSLDLMVTPEQRLKMFRRTMRLIRKGYFVADFWNCGSISNGCFAAGRPGAGYLYIEWNGNVTPCVFVPYAVANINEVYEKEGTLSEVLASPFFKSIRKWQQDYALNKRCEEMGNWILPCPIRDHYQDMYRFLKKYSPKPIDEMASSALKDENYRKGLLSYDRKLEKVIGPVWKKEYLETCRKERRKQN